MDSFKTFFRKNCYYEFAFLSTDKGDSVVIMIGSAVDQQGAVSSPSSTEMVTPTEGEGATGEMASGAASAQNVRFLYRSLGFSLTL